MSHSSVCHFWDGILFRASDQHISTKLWGLGLVLISYQLWSYSVALRGLRISEVLKPDLGKDSPEIWVLLRSGPANVRVPNPTNSMFSKYLFNIYLVEAWGEWFAVMKIQYIYRFINLFTFSGQGKINILGVKTMKVFLYFPCSWFYSRFRVLSKSNKCLGGKLEDVYLRQ